jgi:hypothetical protein
MVLLLLRRRFREAEDGEVADQTLDMVCNYGTKGRKGKGCRRWSGRGGGGAGDVFE